MKGLMAETKYNISSWDLNLDPPVFHRRFQSADDVVCV